MADTAPITVGSDDDSNDDSDFAGSGWDCLSCTMHNDDDAAAKCSTCDTKRAVAEFYERQKVRADESNLTWQCNACTLINQHVEAPVCEVCGTTRTDLALVGTTVSAAAPAAPGCEGCASNAADQASHMGPSGCIRNPGQTQTETETQTPFDDLDDDGGRGSAPATLVPKPTPPLSSGRVGKRRRVEAAQIQKQMDADRAARREREEMQQGRGGYASSPSAPGSATASSTPPLSRPTSASPIDMVALHRARRARQQHASASAGAGPGASADPNLMPGEAAAMQGGRIQQWSLHTDGQASASICERRHVATVKNALSARSPAVKLIKAEYICNPRLVKRFETLQGQHHDHKVVYLFHGTGKQNIKSITEKGFLGKHARSGGKLIWFSRQSTYSYGFTISELTKGVPVGMGMGSGLTASNVTTPSGVMFLCALLVRRSRSSTSNVGDKGQDVITMLDEAACLPMYVLTTDMDMNIPGIGPAFNAFGGKGRSLGGR